MGGGGRVGEEAAGFQHGRDVDVAVADGEEACPLVRVQCILNFLAIHLKILHKNKCIKHLKQYCVKISAIRKT